LEAVKNQKICNNGALLEKKAKKYSKKGISSLDKQKKLVKLRVRCLKKANP